MKSIRLAACRVDAFVIANGGAKHVRLSGRLAGLPVVEIGSNQDLGSNEVAR
jgi:hypothetical protein